MKKITRRQFLTSAGATSAALLLSSLPHAAAADENCLRKVTPAATNSNDLSWDMAEEILTHISDPVFPAYTVNVLDYGAVPNDGKLDTAAIQRAIDETSAHGGGTVVIPSGVYDVGAITLKSNVNLHLESKDTILRFTRDITPANYPLVFAQAVQLEPADLRLSAGEHRSDRQGHPRWSGRQEQLVELVPYRQPGRHHH